MAIFQRPRSFEELFDLIPNICTAEALEEVVDYATDIARAENYPDPVAQAECWLEGAPAMKTAERRV